MQFKNFVSHSKAVVAGVAALAFAGGLLASAPANAADDFEAKLDAWLKSAELGKYHKADDWAEITRKAKEEGELIIYSSSSALNEIGEMFMKTYPEIKVTSHKLGSAKTVEKTIREQDAGIYAVDLVTTTGARSMVYEMFPEKRIINYVPKYLEDRVPLNYREPLLTRMIGALAFFYNKEVYAGGEPIKNIWELTEPKWKSRFATKNPGGSLSTMAAIAGIAGHPEELAAAYKKHTGKDLKLGEDVPDAGYEFLRRLIANDIVIFKSGSKLAAASGKKGQDKPLIVLAPMHYLTRNKTKGYVNAVLEGMEPASVYTYSSYTTIARFAPHPNAAKLMTAFIMGSAELNAKSNITEPYKEGRSAKLLQGLAAEYHVGEASPRRDVPLSADNGVWTRAGKLEASPEYIRNHTAKIIDFWTIEASR
ncbi:MAG: ABC transporter substrate-binding protein [Rhodospirillales bacterium]|nr:ABC transporter substrate-binding protein [Rhodospirillales bacterium]